MAITSPLQKKIKELEERCEILDKIVSVSKTEGGRVSDHGKNLYYILRQAGMTKSDIARVLEVTPSALTRYED